MAWHTLAIAVATTLALAARCAAQSAEAVRVHYEADASCPDKEAFFAEVETRTSVAILAASDSSESVVAVLARAEGSGFIGTVTAAPSAPRQVVADSCADLISALALITTVTLATHFSDPSSELTPLRRESSKPPASTEGELAADKGDAALVQSPEKPQTRIDRAAPTESSSPRAERAVETNSANASERAIEPTDRPSRWFWGPAARLLGASGWNSDPIALFGAALSIEGGAHLGSPLWAPSLRLSALGALSPTTEPAAGRARFSLLSGRFEVSLLRIDLGDAAFVPSFAIEAGELTGHGKSEGSVVAYGAKSKLWLALGYGLTFELSLTRALYCSLLVELQQPLYRYAYSFAGPGGTFDIAAVPALQALTSLGFGMRFQ